ncbi:MAG: hypothetical protein ACI89L_000445 [Phycisphaerales bacterium]|jgi:hypothetical protein
MSTRSRVTAIAALALAAGLAQAQSAPFVVFENGDGIELTGLQIDLEVVDLGTQVRFIVANNSTLESRVTSIYFELTDLSFGALSNPIIENNAGVNYEDDKVAPRKPAGSIKHHGGDWGGTFYGLKPTVPQPNFTGMTTGESVSIVFDLVNGYSGADIANALSNDPVGFRVAMHIQSVGDSGASVWAVADTLVPSPGALAVFGAGSLVAFRRRRAA